VSHPNDHAAAEIESAPRRRRRRLLLNTAIAGAVAVGALATSGIGTAAAAGHFEVVAHRGDMADDPESTLESFGDAIKHGADGIEFDVRFTRDGTAVAMHDDTVDRTTRGAQCKGLVDELTWAILSMCDAGSWFGGSHYPVRVPRLIDAVTYIGSHSNTVHVYLHIKPKVSQGQANHLVNVVKSESMNNARTDFVGENDTVLKRLRKAGAYRLGRMVHSKKDWKHNYPVMVPFSSGTGVLGSKYIKAALGKGDLVLPVEGAPLSVSEILKTGVNGLYANNLEHALRIVGRSMPADPAPPAPATVLLPLAAPAPPPPPTPTPTPTPTPKAASSPAATPEPTSAATPTTAPGDPSSAPPTQPPTSPPTSPPTQPPPTAAPPKNG